MDSCISTCTTTACGASRRARLLSATHQALRRQQRVCELLAGAAPDARRGQRHGALLHRPRGARRRIGCRSCHRSRCRAEERGAALLRWQGGVKGCARADARAGTCVSEAPAPACAQHQRAQHAPEATECVESVRDMLAASPMSGARRRMNEGRVAPADPLPPVGLPAAEPLPGVTAPLVPDASALEGCVPSAGAGDWLRGGRPAAPSRLEVPAVLPPVRQLLDCKVFRSMLPTLLPLVLWRSKGDAMARERHWAQELGTQSASRLHHNVAHLPLGAPVGAAGNADDGLGLVCALPRPLGAPLFAVAPPAPTTTSSTPAARSEAWPATATCNQQCPHHVEQPRSGTLKDRAPRRRRACSHQQAWGLSRV